MTDGDSGTPAGGARSRECVYCAVESGFLEPRDVLEWVESLDVRARAHAVAGVHGAGHRDPEAGAFHDTVGRHGARAVAGDADAAALATARGLTGRLDEQHDRIERQDRRLERQRGTIDEQRADIERLRERLESLQAEVVRLRRTLDGRD